MEAQPTHSPIKNITGKNTEKSENKLISSYLFNKPANSKMLHLELGIPRENICRRKRKLEDSNRLWVVFKDYCPHTGRLSQFLTTNPETKDQWLHR